MGGLAPRAGRQAHWHLGADERNLVSDRPLMDPSAYHAADVVRWHTPTYAIAYLGARSARGVLCLSRREAAERLRP